MPDRDSIFEIVRLQFPMVEPLGTIETWLETISGRETIGFDFNPTNRIIFRGLVEGLDSDGLVQQLRSEFEDDSIEAQRERLLDHAKRMAKSELFFPLLSKSPFREQVDAI
jgi:hypothetical protein